MPLLLENAAPRHTSQSQDARAKQRQARRLRRRRRRRTADEVELFRGDERIGQLGPTEECAGIDLRAANRTGAQDSQVYVIGWIRRGVNVSIGERSFTKYGCRRAVQYVEGETVERQIGGGDHTGGANGIRPTQRRAVIEDTCDVVDGVGMRGDRYGKRQGEREN